MKNKVVIGGYGGSGARVVSMILQKVGYNIGVDKDLYIKTKDYLPILKPIDNCWYNKKCNLKIKEKEPFAIKHGQSILVIPEIKKDNPGVKFILVVRNGIDNILNGFEWEDSYCKNLVIKGENFQRKMSAWTESHKIALRDTDHIVKLEDICFYPEKTIRKLFNFLDIDKDPKKFTSIVKMLMSIGRREHFGERKCKLLFKISKEIMDKFGYTH